MNANHIIGRKLNRYKRLLRRCADMPTDSYKRDRKHVLHQELLNLKKITK